MTWVMADTITIAVSAKTAEVLRRNAREAGETEETLVARLVEEAAAELDQPLDSLLTHEQLADLKQRLKEPRRFASDEEVEAFFARFRSRKE